MSSNLLDTIIEKLPTTEEQFKCCVWLLKNTDADIAVTTTIQCGEYQHNISHNLQELKKQDSFYYRFKRILTSIKYNHINGQADGFIFNEMRVPDDELIDLLTYITDEDIAAYTNK